MQGSLIYAAVIVILFVVAFFSKRRFGVLGLALAAGSILSDIWTSKVLDIVRSNGVVVESYASTVLAVLIILLPALILLFKGYSYRNLIGRLVGSTMFAMLGLAFLIEPLSHYWIIQGVLGDILNVVFDKRFLIIGVGLIFTVADFLIARPSHGEHDRSHHKEARH